MLIRSLRTAVFCLLVLSIFTVGAAVYLDDQAPRQERVAMMAALVPDNERVLAMSGNRFACTESDTLVWCTVQIEGQALDMGIRRTTRGGSVTECSATLDGRDLACRATYSMRSLAPMIVIEDDLGLSSDQLGQLRRTHWLDNISEKYWIWTATFVGILFGLNVLWILWLLGKRLFFDRKSQFAMSGLGGVLAYGSLWFVWMLILLGQGWVD